MQASHCEQVQAAVLQPQPAGPAFWWTPVRFGSVQCRAIANQHGNTNRTTTGCHQSSIKRALIHFETKPWLCAGAALKRAFKASERRQLRRAVARGIYSPFGAQQPRWPPWASRRRRPSCISLRHMDVYVLVVSTRYIFFMRFLLRSPDSGVDLVVADRKYLGSLKCQNC